MATPLTPGSGPNAVVTGDFNLDRKPDAATANGRASNVLTINVTILLGDGAGGFSTDNTDLGGGSPVAIVTGDFNQDGKPDLATANAGSSNVSILLGDGIGGFSASTVGIDGGLEPTSLTVQDFNLDGSPDLATRNSLSQNETILLGDGLGEFLATTIELNGGSVNPASIHRSSLDSLVRLRSSLRSRPRMAEVDVFDRRRELELSTSQATGQGAVFFPDPLLVDQQANRSSKLRLAMSVSSCCWRKASAMPLSFIV